MNMSLASLPRYRSAFAVDVAVLAAGAVPAAAPAGPCSSPG